MTPQDFLTFWIEDAIKEGKLVALIEGLQEDEIFWRDVFSVSTNGKIQLDFPFASDTQQTGKDALTPYYEFLTDDNFKGGFIICRDSDNEYLYFNPKQRLFSFPYFFHTHTYSIESHKIMPNILTQNILDWTGETFDFQPFFEAFSKITYPLWVAHIWLQVEIYQLIAQAKVAHQSGDDTQIFNQRVEVLNQLCSAKALKRVLKFDFQLKNVTEISLYLSSLQQKVTILLRNIEAEINQPNLFVETNLPSLLGNRLITEINANETIFYWNGHIILEKVISPFVDHVRKLLANEKADKYQSNELKNKYKKYALDVSVNQKLAENHKNCFLPNCSNTFLEKIKQDINNHFPNC